MRRYELIQTTTKKIVELIKVLIDHANSCVWDGVTNASNKIYQETQDMATALLLKVLIFFKLQTLNLVASCTPFRIIIEFPFVQISGG